ncbi:hypothetical protein FQR65_LT19021 [Abscondita terminalis]|nr:hypothetical protein FQR65_LT19021 [Abscondita terminalis]
MQSGEGTSFTSGKSSINVKKHNEHEHMTMSTSVRGAGLTVLGAVVSLGACCEEQSLRKTAPRKTTIPNPMH